jgi:putative FmdB family regulatory protein
MPIYEYRCQSCKHTLEELQKMNDKPLTDCPECGEPALRRLVSAPSFRLKGGGWYETDFKSDKETKRNIADTHSGGSGEAATADAKTSKSANGGKSGEKSGEKKAVKSESKSTSNEAKNKPDKPKNGSSSAVA